MIIPNFAKLSRKRCKSSYESAVISELIFVDKLFVTTFLQFRCKDTRILPMLFQDRFVFLEEDHVLFPRKNRALST